MILVAGVAELYQGDLDVGRRAVELLAEEDLGEDVLVEELSYGAVAVAQRLEELRPDSLVLVGAAERGRSPGEAVRLEHGHPTLSPTEIQAAVVDAVTGYVGLDLLVAVAFGLGVLPGRTVVVEVEPARTEPSEQLSPQAARGLDEALRLVRAEITRLRAGRGSADAPPPAAPRSSR